MKKAILRLFIVAEHHLRMENILYAFWSMFWLLNGFDKFLNGQMQETPWGKVAMGWFGVNRDAKMVHYFSRLSLPGELALFSLYSIAILEIVIGLMFLWILFSKSVPLFVQRLAFKLSMVVFFLFCTGDILFGDRMELWEHGTFMVLALATFKMYLRAGAIRKDVVGKRFTEFDVNKDGEICEVEYDKYFEKVWQEK